MFRQYVAALAAGLLFASCSRDGGKTGAPDLTATNAISSGETPQPDFAAVLAELTQALRKYSAEQRRVPDSLSELVSAGYLQQLPAAPPGKAFVIDTKQLKVGVK